MLGPFPDGVKILDRDPQEALELLGVVGFEDIQSAAPRRHEEAGGSSLRSPRTLRMEFPSPLIDTGPAGGGQAVLAALIAVEVLPAENLPASMAALVPGRGHDGTCLHELRLSAARVDQVEEPPRTPGNV